MYQGNGKHNNKYDLKKINTKDLLEHVKEYKSKFSAFTEYRLKQFIKQEYMYIYFLVSLFSVSR